MLKAPQSKFLGYAMTEKIIPIIEDREILIEDDIQESVSENKKPKKSVAEKKNEKRIMRLAGKAIAEFGMIEGGDKVMVCMSGGKDSYVLLDVLMKLQKRAPVPFELIAVNVDQHLPNFPKDVIPNYLKKSACLTTLKIKTPGRLFSV